VNIPEFGNDKPMAQVLSSGSLRLIA